MQAQIVRLEPLRIAFARAVSAEPEHDAFKILTTWAQAQGLADREGYRVFGFNNPNPTPHDPVYGYEVWMTAGPEVQPKGGPVGIKEFAGGLYAVAHIKPRSGDDIPKGWHELHQWVVNSGYRHGNHQWLEEHIGRLGQSWEDGVEMDLYYPLAE